MNIHLSLMPLSLLFLTLFTPVQDKVKQAQLEGLNITMTLRKRTPTPQQADWPAETVTLTAQSVAVNGKLIHQLLMDNHIFPDVEAFSIVYALNPQIQQLSNLTVSQLRVPVVQGGAGLKADFGSGFMVFLTVDKELKDRFVANVKELTIATQSVSSFGPERFQSPADKESIVTSLKSISDTLNRIDDRIIQRFGRPIPTEALSQLNADVELLNRMLISKVSSEAKINKKEQDQIAAVERDISVKRRAFTEVAAGGAPERWPEVKVIVKTLKGSSEVPSLRIYYVPEALKEQSSEVHSFGVLSSPSTQSIPEADYCFWAAKDPDKSAVTNEQCVEIRINKQAEVQLTVVH
jgi:hypothetical protein